MTDEQIINELNIRIDDFSKATLTLIKYQKAEIERLQKENESIRYCYSHAVSYNNKLLDACEYCMKGKTEKIEAIKTEVKNERKNNEYNHGIKAEI